MSITYITCPRLYNYNLYNLKKIKYTIRFFYILFYFIIKSVYAFININGLFL